MQLWSTNNEKCIRLRDRRLSSGCFSWLLLILVLASSVPLNLTCLGLWYWPDSPYLSWFYSKHLLCPDTFPAVLPAESLPQTPTPTHSDGTWGLQSDHLFETSPYHLPVEWLWARHLTLPKFLICKMKLIYFLYRTVVKCKRKEMIHI